MRQHRGREPRHWDFGIIFKFFSKIEDTVEFAPILGEDGTAIAGGGDGGNHVNIELSPLSLIVKNCFIFIVLLTF